MKNIYAVIISLFLLNNVNAQVALPFGSGDNLKRPISVPNRPSMASRFADQIIVDYDYADSVSQLNIAGNIYDTRYAWDMNMHYDLSDTAYSFNLLHYCTVVFDSILDSYNQVPYDRTTLQSIVMDSVFVWLGQENNSGLDDTLLVKLISVNANRTPNNTPAGVLWTDTVIIPASQPLDASWLQFHLLAIPVNYIYTSNTQRTAIKLEYWGDKADTAGFLAGFGYNGTCTSGAQICYDTYMNPVPYNPFNSWAQLPFKVNSYIWYHYFNAEFPGVSTGWLYNECNMVSGYQIGADALFRIQNIGLMAMMTVSDQVGIHEQSANGMKLLQNSPNPFSNQTTIQYSLQKPSNNVTIEITDATGRVISIINEGNRAAGVFSTPFNAGKFADGIYFYTLKTESGSVTNRMMIKR